MTRRHALPEQVTARSRQLDAVDREVGELDERQCERAEWTEGEQHVVEARRLAPDETLGLALKGTELTLESDKRTERARRGRRLTARHGGSDRDTCGASGAGRQRLSKSAEGCDSRTGTRGVRPSG
ncbi:hypothetical protein PHYPSEUDO_007619 [Phytophthora pseudosyringae]|uniref:Uncharacterized protein n=1 Tax=Phytophthora pseudosyringae TaxID=221518 RepID=A0A8T1VJD2_9STRA|nr:hypothetical protein PHYPSEUDO_007619 [Phytophthora pseudosyringae]